LLEDKPASLITRCKSMASAGANNS